MKELDFIAELTEVFGKENTTAVDDTMLLKGIGDDCAVFSSSSRKGWAISTDMLVENVHFRLDWHSPFLLGRKCVAVNLSDLAAMGAEPGFALIAAAFPESLDAHWLTDWQKGVASVLKEYNCRLIGGDTTSGDRLVINVTVLGQGDQKKLLYRSGARPGHDIYVTGTLGDSAGGFHLLQRNLQCEKYPGLCAAHLNPVPQIKAGRALAESGLVGAMQDLSDGIATDLAHICRASSAAALLEEGLLPNSAELRHLCEAERLDILQLMLCGGEDYQLVFTAEKTNRTTLQQLAAGHGFRITRIGRIESGNGVFLADSAGCRKEITFSGYEHGR